MSNETEGATVGEPAEVVSAEPAAPGMIDNPLASEQGAGPADVAPTESEGDAARRITRDSPAPPEPRKIPGGYGGTLTPWHKGDPRAAEASRIGNKAKRDKRAMAEAAVLVGLKRGVESVSDRPISGARDAIAAIAEQQSILAYSGERGSTQAARFVFEAGGLMGGDRRQGSDGDSSSIRFEISGPVAERVAEILAGMMGRK